MSHTERADKKMESITCKTKKKEKLRRFPFFLVDDFTQDWWRSTVDSRRQLRSNISGHVIGITGLYVN